MNDWIKIGIVGAAAVVVYFAATNLFAASSCTNPGSSCYVAAKPYLDAWQICATQYASVLKQYYAQNNASGIGLTATQISNLGYLTKCMNDNAALAGAAAIQANPSINSIIGSVLTAWGGYIVAGVVALGLISRLPSLITKLRGGVGVANALNRQVTQDSINGGVLTRTSAPNLALSLDTSYSGLTSLDNEFFTTLQIEGVITAEDAVAFFAEDSLALVSDKIILQDLLRAV